MAIPSYEELPVAEAAARAQRGDVILLDVRSPAEFSAKHVPGAVNLPLTDLTPEEARRLADGRQILVICHSGGRGREGCRLLRSSGIDATNVTGGTAAWEQSGLPIVQSAEGVRIISLERQVRICAGFLVATGSLLSWFASPSFIALPLFIGCGLMFAGITDWCGMGLLLSRAPWNRAKGSR